MMRWNPYGGAMPLRQVIDRLMEDAVLMSGRGAHDGGSGIEMDLMEHDDALEVQACLPGVKPEDVDITLQDNVLTIRGEFRAERTRRRDGAEQQAQRQPAQGGSSAQERREPNDPGKKPTARRQEAGETGQQARYHQRERRYGHFLRQIALPIAVSADEAEARFEDGVLMVTLPKAEEAKQKRISITGQNSATRDKDRPAIEGQKADPRPDDRAQQEHGDDAGRQEQGSRRQTPKAAQR